MTSNPGRLKAFLWLAVDNIFAIFVVGVLVASFWRGTWELLDLIAPDDPPLNIWICVAFGNCGLLAACLLQEPLENCADKLSWSSMGRIATFVFKRIYSYVIGFCSVSQWRGLWVALDYYTGLSDASFLSSIVAGQCILWIFRSSKILSAAPAHTGHDSDRDFFKISSRFQQKPPKLGMFILDHLFTAIVLWNCVVLVWRGVWGLADNHIYPDDFEKSSWASFAIGAGLMILMIPLQTLGNMLYVWMAKDSEVHVIWRILLEDLLQVVVTVAVIHHWRGVFYLEDIYLLPDHPNPALSPAVSQVVGYASLCLLLVSISSAGVGSHVAGDEHPKFGCLVNNGYFRFFLSISPYDEEDNLETTKNLSRSSSLRRKNERPSTYGSISPPSSA